MNDLEYVVWPSNNGPDNNNSYNWPCSVYLLFNFFLCASIILLIAMIGSIVLTMHKGVFVKRQDVFEQNTRDFSKTVQKLKHSKQFSQTCKVCGESIFIQQTNLVFFSSSVVRAHGC